MAKEARGIFGEEKNSFTIADQVNKYKSYWLFILICVLLCSGAGFLYSRYKVPKYIANTSFIIKTSQYGENTSDLIEAAMNGKKQINLNNEILLINSSGLMQRTVAKGGFNTRYFIKGRLLTIDLYKDAPFTLEVNHIKDSGSTYTMHINSMNSAGGTFIYGVAKDNKNYAFKWNTPFRIDGQSFTLVPKEENIANSEVDYIVVWQPVKAAAGEISSTFSVKATDTKANVIELSLKTENLQRGKDILNALFTEFNSSDIEDRNKLSDSTVNFINERLIGVTEELKGVEGDLESFQGSRQLVDVKGQAALSLDNSSETSKMIKDINVQQRVTNMIAEYFDDPANSNKLVPSSLGLDDPTLSTLLAQYNELQLKKGKEAPNVATNSTVMQDLNSQTENLRGSILENLNNIRKNLKVREGSFVQQNRQYNSFLSALPHNERALLEIKRKQGISEGLYLYLLQKREEAAISSTSADVAHYKQIDPAGGYGPVEPNTRNIIMYTVLLGLCIAFGTIYLKEALNNKIASKEDITKKTSLPLAGQISHITKKNRKPIAVLDRTIIAEQFRAIRTNLSLLLKGVDKKVILITSSVSNEGKSFVSQNLAAVFAMPGAKVALVEFDIRQPVIADNLNLTVTTGLTDYLNGNASNLSQIMYEVSEIPTLHVYPAGPAPLNAGDLLLTEQMPRLFAALKAQYEYIIIDTPPAELVSDAFVIGEYSDIVLFVLRQGITPRKQVSFINDLSGSDKFKKTALLLNDVRAGKELDYYYTYERSGKSKAKKRKETK